MGSYYSLQSKFGANTIAIALEYNLQDTGRYLSHEGGYAKYYAGNLKAYYKWLKDNPGVSVGGHGGGNPSGEETDLQKAIYLNNKKKPSKMINFIKYALLIVLMVITSKALFSQDSSFDTANVILNAEMNIVSFENSNNSKEEIINIVDSRVKYKVIESKGFSKNIVFFRLVAEPLNNDDSSNYFLNHLISIIQVLFLPTIQKILKSIV